jgi:hypothetical protein
MAESGSGGEARKLIERFKRSVTSKKSDSGRKEKGSTIESLNSTEFE